MVLADFFDFFPVVFLAGFLQFFYVFIMFFFCFLCYFYFFIFSPSYTAWLGTVIANGVSIEKNKKIKIKKHINKIIKNKNIIKIKKNWRKPAKNTTGKKSKKSAKTTPLLSYLVISFLLLQNRCLSTPSESSLQPLQNKEKPNWTPKTNYKTA